MWLKSSGAALGKHDNAETTIRGAAKARELLGIWINPRRPRISLKRAQCVARSHVIATCNARSSQRNKCPVLVHAVQSMFARAGNVSQSSLCSLHPGQAGSMEQSHLISCHSNGLVRMTCESQWLYWFLLDPLLSSPALPCEHCLAGVALHEARIPCPRISLCSWQTDFPHVVKPPNAYGVPVEGKFQVSLLVKSLPSLPLSTSPSHPMSHSCCADRAFSGSGTPE